MIIVSISLGSLLAYNQSAFVNEQIKCRCILFGCIGIRLETQFVARKSEIPNQWTEEDACPMIRAGISFDPAYTWKTCNCKQRPDYYLSDRTDKRETGRIEICFLTHKNIVSRLTCFRLLLSFGFGERVCDKKQKKPCVRHEHRHSIIKAFRCIINQNLR